MKQKAFVVLPTGGSALSELNQLLERGWTVVEIQPKKGGAPWLVVAQEPRYGEKKAAGEES